MLNIVWGLMIALGILISFFNGKIDIISDGILDSTKESISLLITMLGVVSMWCGIIKIAEGAGIMDKMTGFMKPLIYKLFPNIKEENAAVNYMAANMAANILGLGWAATPAGLKAMKELSRISIERGEDPDTASDEMCTFLVINISSLQLIPMTIIAFRSQYGSVNPAAIVFPGIIATTISTLVAIVICLIVISHNKKK